MAMFPPSIPRVFIDWLTREGDVVYDPFSGRGTTILEACISGRVGLGSDANPLAWILSSTKASPPSLFSVRKRVAELRAQFQPSINVKESTVIRALFHPRVLEQLVWLKDELSTRLAVDRFITASLAGVLHANARADGTARGLTISMPNTFAMAPAYVMRYKEAHGLKPPNVDVLSVLENRVSALGNSPIRTRGHAWIQDTAQPIRIPRGFKQPSLIFTSPPYLGVMKYAKLNWIRMWLLGRTPAEVDAELFASGSLPKYLKFMSLVINNLERVLAKNGRICLVIGDVKKGESNINLAQSVADNCVSNTSLKVDAIVNDAVPQKHKVSRIWGERRGRATKTDRILILSRPGTLALPRLPSMDWSKSNTLRRPESV